MDRRSPAGFLEADRGAGEQLGVVQRPADRRRLAEGVERLDRPPGPVTGVAKVELDGAALPAIVDAERQGRAQALGRLLESQPCRCRLGGEQVVRDGPFALPHGCRLCVVVRERGEPAPSGPGCGLLLQCPGHAQVQPGPAGGRDAVVDGPAHELVGEPVGEAPASGLLEEAAAHSLVDRVEQGAFFERGGAAHRVELELGPDHGAELEHLAGRPRQAGEAVCDDLAHRLGRPDVVDRVSQPHGQQPHLERLGIDQVAPELGEEERVPVRQAEDRLRHLPRPLCAGGQAHELRHLVVAQPAQAHANDALRPGDVDQGLRERRRHVGLEVAEGGDEQHPRGAAGSHQVADEQQRRDVRPVHVLQHEQHRRAPADRREQVREGGVQEMALGVRVGGAGRRQAADEVGQVGEEARQLAAPRPEVGSQRRRVAAAHERVEGLHERPVRCRDDGVAGPVEHDGALGCERLSRARARGGSSLPPARRRRAPRAAPRRARAAAGRSGSQARGSVRRTGTTVAGAAAPGEGARR